MVNGSECSSVSQCEWVSESTWTRSRAQAGTTTLAGKRMALRLVISSPYFWIAHTMWNSLLSYTTKQRRIILYQIICEMRTSLNEAYKRQHKIYVSCSFHDKYPNNVNFGKFNCKFICFFHNTIQRNYLTDCLIGFAKLSAFSEEYSSQKVWLRLIPTFEYRIFIKLLACLN